LRGTKLRLHHTPWINDTAVRLDQSTRARLEAKLGEFPGEPLIVQVDSLHSKVSADSVDPVPVVVVIVAKTGRPDPEVRMSTKKQDARRLLDLLKTAKGVFCQANEGFL